MSSAESFGGDPQDIRPVIKTGSSSNWGVWAFGAVLLMGGFMLFNALSASEEQSAAPSVLLPEDGGNARISSPPPLRTPERFASARELPPVTLQSEPARPQREPALAIQRIVQPYTPPSFALPEPPPSSQDIEPPEELAPQVVFEGPARIVPPSNPAARGEAEGDERVSAGRLRNPSRTVPQGTVIPAVLETALDSTRAGGVRALVQRDVSSFDGTRVLVPRGSRLYGEYESGLQQGQNRALVQWTRLIRPDGVTIALNSPSSDPLGRAGIRGKVDSKFFQRFGGALLRSVLDIGVGLAVNEASDGVIVALPGSTQNVQVTQPQSIQPTLKVRQGTSVSVFVARDLDFSSVDP